jgi:hypothetical protein
MGYIILTNFVPNSRAAFRGEGDTSFQWQKFQASWEWGITFTLQLEKDVWHGSLGEVRDKLPEFG